MGCKGSKARSAKPHEAKAAETGTQENAVHKPREGGNRASIDFAASPFRVANEDVGGSGVTALSAQPRDRHRRDDYMPESPTTGVAPSLLRVGSEVPPTAGGVSPPPPAATTGVSRPSAHASPQLTQCMPSRVGLGEGTSAGKIGPSDEPYDFNGEDIRGPPPLEHAHPFASTNSTTAVVHPDTFPLPMLRSIGPVKGPLDSADQPRATSPHRPNKPHATSSSELHQGDSINGVQPVLVQTLGGISTTGTALPHTADTRPAPEQRPVFSDVVQETSPLRLPASVTCPPGTRTAGTHCDPNRGCTGSISGNASSVEHSCCPALPSPERPSPDPMSSTRPQKVLVSSAPVHISPQIPLWSRPIPGSNADALLSDGARGGGSSSTNRELLATQSTRQRSVGSVTLQLPSPSTSQPLTAEQQIQRTAAQMPLEFSHGFTFVSPSTTTTQRSNSSCVSAPSVTPPADFTTPGGGDAPGDVSLPQHFDFCNELHASNGDRGGAGGGVRTPRLHMPNYASIRACATQGHSESVYVVPTVPGSVGASIYTPPRTSPSDFSNMSAHRYTRSNNSWPLNSMSSADGGGFLVCGRGNDGISTSLPTPTNWEVVQQIRQPTTHVKSILRKSGGTVGTTYSATAVKDGGMMNTHQSAVHLLSANGGGARYSSGTNADFISCTRSSGDSASGGDGRISRPSSIRVEPAFRRDFIALHSSSTCNAECINGGNSPPAAPVLVPGMRSLMLNGSPAAPWMKPIEANTVITTNGSDSLVDAVHGSGVQSDGGTPLIVEELRSSASPHLISFSSPIQVHLSPNGSHQHCSTGASSGGGASVGDGMTPVLSPLPAVEPSSSFTPEALAMTWCTSDDPPPDIMLASPPRKRVHVVV